MAVAMSTLPRLKSEEFFINKDKYEIRQLEKTDFEVDFNKTEELPDATEDPFLFGQKPIPDTVKLQGIYDYNNATAVAFIALKRNVSAPGDRVGLAVCALNPTYASHQFYLSVDKSLKATRLPAELLSMLANHAKTHNVATLFCYADEHNVNMRALAETTRMSVRLDSRKSHMVKYSLNLEEHPDIVKF